MKRKEKAKRNKHILIVSDSYPPEVRSAAQLMRDLAEGLTGRGYKVSVVTSYPRYNLAEGTKKAFPKIREENGVRVLRVKTLPHHKVNFIIRGLAQLTMPLIFIYGVKKYIKEPIDAVITHSPPLPLYGVGKKIKGTHGSLNILNVHDIFPQNAVDLGIMNNKFLIKFFERMERNAYKFADFLVVPSVRHKEFLEEKRDVPEKKVKVVEHWIDVEEFKKAKRTGRYRKEYGLEGKVVFLFAGVLGPSQGLEMLIWVAREMKEYRNLHFLFVGEGAAKENLERMVRKYGLKNVSFKPFVPLGRYPELVKDCDVCLVALTSKNTTPAVPAKLMGYMAAGMPVAVFVHKESYARDVVEESGCGVTAPSGDKWKVVQSLRSLYQDRKKWKILGSRARKYAEEHFSKDRAIDKIEALLKKKI